MKNQQQPPQQTEFSEDEHMKEPSSEEPRRKPSGTPFGTWMTVFGSSTVFHALLLILLGLIMIGEQAEQRTEIALEPSEVSDSSVEKPVLDPEDENDVEETSQSDRPDVSSNNNTPLNELRSEKTGKTKINVPTRTSSQTDRISALKDMGNQGEFGRRPGGGEPGGGPLGGNGPEGSGGKEKPRWDVIEAALTWLAKHQEEDGYWDADNYDRQCPNGNKCKRFLDQQGTNDVGITGLSLLAFLGAGYTHQSDEKLDGIDVGNVIHKSLHWLKNQQKDNGAFDDGARQMYNHAIAAMAYAEAYGMTPSAAHLKGPAQDGIDFLHHAQNERGGQRLAWRYEANDGENDTSVTGWAAMALKSAEIARLETSEEAMQGALRWVKQNTNKRGLTGYTSKVTSRGQAHKRRAMTSVGMLVRLFASDQLNKEQVRTLIRGAEYVVKKLPKWKKGATFQGNHNDRRMDFYHWYYGSLALYMFAGPDTRFASQGYWQKWNEPMERAIMSGVQRAAEGHEVGSWDPVSRWASGGGRIYTTALNTLTLEVYHRYDNALFK